MKAANAPWRSLSRVNQGRSFCARSRSHVDHSRWHDSIHAANSAACQPAASSSQKARARMPAQTCEYDPSLAPSAIDVDALGRALPTGGLPPLDLLIRTSGEQRISNFMLWEAAYAELILVDVMWPDFRRNDLYRCLESYAGRERRFGLTSAQLTDPDSDVEPTAG